MTLDFGVVLGRMWKIGWTHKVLWLFQMLPMLFTILMFPFMFLANPAFVYLLPEPYNQFGSEAWMGILFFLLMLILVIVSAFVNVLGQTSTTLGALKADRGAEKLAFRDLLNESLPYFWRVLGLYTLFGLGWFAITFLFMFLNVGVSMITFGLGAICMVPLFLLLFPVALAGYAVLELAQAAIIADNITTIDAISKAWGMFRANVLSVGLLMLILYFGLAIIGSVFIFPMMLPMMSFPLWIEDPDQFNSAFLMMFLVFFPIIMAFMSIVQGILMAFFQSSWAVAYHQLEPDRNRPVFIEANA